MRDGSDGKFSSLRSAVTMRSALRWGSTMNEPEERPEMTTTTGSTELTNDMSLRSDALPAASAAVDRPEEPAVEANDASAVVDAVTPHRTTQRTRTATIDLSGYGAAITLGDGATSSERIRLQLGSRTAHLITSIHPLVDEIAAIELTSVSAVGNAEEFAQWLGDLTDVQFLVVTDAAEHEDLAIANVRGVARLSMGIRRDHALRELAQLLGRHPEDIINDFRQRTGFQDLGGLIDVTTLCVNTLNVRSAREYSMELGLLIDALGTMVMILSGRGEASVVTTSLEPVEQRWLVEAGWPLAAGLDADLAEILRGSRSRAGRSVPAWVRAHGLWGAAVGQRTVSMANVAAHLHRNRVDLGACIPRGRANADRVGLMVSSEF